MLKLEHVTKYYDDFRAVNDLSFEIHEGEIFGLLGVNGAGKTTTFRMIMGLLDITEGKITLNDKKIDYSVTDEIGFLTEERSLLPSKTVLEQAIYYGVLKGLTEKEVEKRLDKYLEEFKPDIEYQGTAGYSGYIAFAFSSKNIYVLDSILYGNATYIFGGNWEEISQLTQKQIIDDNLYKYRIIHDKKWKTEIGNILNSI